MCNPELLSEQGSTCPARLKSAAVPCDHLSLKCQGSKSAAGGHCHSGWWCLQVKGLLGKVLIDWSLAAKKMLQKWVKRADGPTLGISHFPNHLPRVNPGLRFHCSQRKSTKQLSPLTLQEANKYLENVPLKFWGRFPHWEQLETEEAVACTKAVSDTLSAAVAGFISVHNSYEGK